MYSVQVEPAARKARCLLLARVAWVLPPLGETEAYEESGGVAGTVAYGDKAKADKTASEASIVGPPPLGEESRDGKTQGLTEGLGEKSSDCNTQGLTEPLAEKGRGCRRQEAPPVELTMACKFGTVGPPLLGEESRDGKTQGLTEGLVEKSSDGKTQGLTEPLGEKGCGGRMQEASPVGLTMACKPGTVGPPPVEIILDSKTPPRLSLLGVSAKFVPDAVTATQFPYVLALHPTGLAVLHVTQGSAALALFLCDVQAATASRLPTPPFPLHPDGRPPRRFPAVGLVADRAGDEFLVATLDHAGTCKDMASLMVYSTKT